MRRVNLLHAHGSPTHHLHRRHGCRCVACRAAVGEYNRKYRAEHAEEQSEYLRKYRAEHKEEIAEHDRNRAEGRSWSRRLEKYGINPQEWGDVFAKQGNRCAIDRAEEPGGRHGAWHTDHDHKTGRVRGILCSRCNMGIGLFRDDPKVLMAAIEYLAAATP